MVTSDSLLHCPKNLKECLDWLVRISGKETGTNPNNTDSLRDVSKAVKAELEAAKLDVPPEFTSWITTFCNHIVNTFLGIDQNEFCGKGIGKSGTMYESSYNLSASWDLLCSSGSSSGKCCGSNPSCQCPSASSQFPPGGCCEECPRRKCAKIFLGMLPCLYYALKFLREMCKEEKSKGGWNNVKFKDRNGVTPLGHFLIGMGYDLEKLDYSKNGEKISSLINGPNGSLDIVYNIVSKKYFPSPSPVPPSDSKPKPPQTVREMLLWLYGLRFTPGFSSLVLYCFAICSTFGNSFNSDAFCYYIHTCSFILPVAVISFIEDSSSAQKVFSSSSSPEWKDFYYPSDSSALADMLFDLVRKVFVALKFLYYQCERVGSQVGWRYCFFGQKCSLPSGPVSSSSSSNSCDCDGSKTYLCSWTYDKNKDVHDEHCGLNGGGKCINAKPCEASSNHNDPKSKCIPCPHPLQRFLTATSQSQSQDYPFGLPGITPMGFTKQNLSSTPVQGLSLHYAVKVFCDSGFYPLTRLAEFSLCISRYPPETLGEFFAFFMKFKGSSVFTKKLVPWIEDEPGRPNGSALKDAVQGLYGSDKDHWPSGRNGSGTHKASSESPANLFSLSGCNGAKNSGSSPPTCGRYLYPLTENAYNIFITDFVDTYVSWICYLTKDFKEKLKEFLGEFSKSSNSCCSSSSSCKQIVKCPCILPKLYKYGFTFHSPGDLACEYGDGRSRHPTGQGQHDEDQEGCTKKTCSQFLEQLGKVLEDSDSVPLKKLLDAIDKFLWSIRFPFFFGFLYVWFFVLSYFCYVILIKLDTFHTGSHLHLPRSFKILPSTLFSDASSKLKDLSYFTL